MGWPDAFITEIGLEANLSGSNALKSITYDGQYGDGATAQGRQRVQYAK